MNHWISDQILQIVSPPSAACRQASSCIPVLLFTETGEGHEWVLRWLNILGKSASASHLLGSQPHLCQGCAARKKPLAAHRLRRGNAEECRWEHHLYIHIDSQECSYCLLKVALHLWYWAPVDLIYFQIPLCCCCCPRLDEDVEPKVRRLLYESR